MIINATPILRSVSSSGADIFTVALTYPRIIHAELLTHRVFSRNSSSSRAIPVERMIKDVHDNPFIPTYWGRNIPGMQAKEEIEHKWKAKAIWVAAAEAALRASEGLAELGVHKQLANRVTEPYQHINVLVTATEWDNFFTLRNHPDAQPEIQELAKAIYTARAQCIPQQVRTGSWHIPYIKDDEYLLSIEDKLKVSTARCARVSYNLFDGKQSDYKKDIALYEKLVVSQPIHASPTEHQAQALFDATKPSRNFVGWEQYRVSVEKGFKV